MTRVVRVALVRGELWLWAHGRSLAILAGMVFALWIWHGYAENGRYKVYQRQDRAPLMVDSRTGELFVFSSGHWAAVAPPAPAK